MTSERVYQKSLTFNEAIKKLEFLSTTEIVYDKDVVQKLKEILIENKDC